MSRPRPSAALSAPTRCWRSCRTTPSGGDWSSARGVAAAPGWRLLTSFGTIWTHISAGQCGSCQSRSTQGDVGDRSLPNRGARRPCRRLATKCDHHHIAYNSCKNRHCPKCQGPAARDWMEARAEDLLPVEYFHVVFTLPAEIARIAYWNQKAVYGLLFRASAQTVMTIAADPRHLGARIGMTAVLHSWGSALTHHPHIHMIVPGGGLSPDGTKWVACKPGFFLHVRVLSRLFRRLFLDGLMDLHRAGQLAFFGDLEGLLAPRGRCLRQVARPVPQNRMGGLCQTALRRARGGAGLSQPLHAPRRYLKPTPRQRRCRHRGVSAGRTTGSRSG